MKIINLLCLLIFNMSCKEHHNLITVSEETTKIFVGYKNKVPYYIEQETNKLVAVNDTYYEIQLPTDCEMYLITDSTICYSEKVNNTSTLYLVNANDTIKVNFEKKPSNVFSNGHDYFVNCNGTDKIYKIVKNTAVYTGINGQINGIDGNFLFYSQESEKTEYVSASIFKLNLLDRNSTLVTDDIIGDLCIVFPNGIIFSYKLHNGEYRPIIYNPRTQKTEFIVVDPFYLNTTPYMSFNGRSIIFYDANSLKTFIYEIQ